MRAFAVLWVGQFVSLVGSGLTRFALGVWVYQETGSVTRFALIALAASLPALLLSPLAGALVDRWDRRRMLILSDLGSAIPTALLVALLAAGRLDLWHIYPLVALGSAFEAIQFPAFSASVTLLVAKRHLGRASGMMQLAHGGARILAPLLGGVLVVAVGLPGVVVIDLLTFGMAVASLLAVSIPRPRPTAAGRASLLEQILEGWRYLVDRPPLLVLLAYFAVLNLVVPFGLVLATPLVLSFAGAERLGSVLAAGSAGVMAGSLLMSAWGGPPRKARGILAWTLPAAAGLVLAGLQPSAVWVGGGLFLLFASLAVINGCSQALWQSKVEPGLQGRVFAVRRMVAQITGPVAFLIAGPIAERVFEPLLLPGGPLAASLGGWLGTGPGRGLGLLFVVLGALLATIATVGATVRRLRDLDGALPDAVPAEPAAAG